MVKIRLRRTGAKKQPHYRVVVTDSRAPRDGRFIETIGHYNPRTEPPTMEIDAERALYWLSVGAQPSAAVKRMLDKLGILAQAAAIKRGEVPPGAPMPEPKPTVEEEELPELEPEPAEEEAADFEEVEAEEEPAEEEEVEPAETEEEPEDEEEDAEEAGETTAAEAAEAEPVETEEEAPEVEAEDSEESDDQETEEDDDVAEDQSTEDAD